MRGLLSDIKLGDVRATDKSDQARHAVCGFLSGLCLLLLKFLLSAAHLVVVFDVAALALALGIERLDTCVGTVSGHATSSVLMITVIAHALSVQGKIHMRTGIDLALFAA